MYLSFLDLLLSFEIVFGIKEVKGLENFITKNSKKYRRRRKC